jgi:uncharacterized low-complexity protein
MGGNYAEQTEVRISSLIDTWLLLREMEVNGERNRGLYVVKSRGMAHSNQVREFILTNNGIKLLPVYLGAAGVLTGSARVTLEQREQEEEVLRRQDVEREKLALQSKRQAMAGPNCCVTGTIRCGTESCGASSHARGTQGEANAGRAYSDGTKSKSGILGRSPANRGAYEADQEEQPHQSQGDKRSAPDLATLYCRSNSEIS